MSRRKHCAFTADRTDWSVLFEETVRVRFDGHGTKLITLCGQNLQCVFAILRGTTLPPELRMGIRNPRYFLGALLNETDK
jgi:hypothetical protein